MTTEPANERRATIMEVAKLAQVSHQTVSRYFRDNASLKEATRAKVSAAVDELRYRPNPAARSMRTRTTGRIAVVVPTLTYSPARMLAGASAVAHSAGYGVDVLSVEGDSRARTARVLELADSGQVDGIVAFAPLDESATASTSARIQVAAELDDQMRGIGELADASPVVELVEGLAALGHTRFLHVAGAQQFASARARKQGYIEAIARLGLHSVGVFDGDWAAESGMRAIEEMTEEGRATAVIAANDLLAAGVIRAAAQRGWRVPQDLSVTGWDNQALGQYLLPSLTTVDVDLEQVGARATARLIETLTGRSLDIVETPLNHVIWRESTDSVPL